MHALPGRNPETGMHTVRIDSATSSLPPMAEPFWPELDGDHPARTSKARCNGCAGSRACAKRRARHGAD